MKGEEADYVEANSFAAREIKVLLPRLEDARIRFFLEVDDSGIRNMSPGTARWGTSGRSAQMKVFVHEKDSRRYNALVRRLMEP